ncbi:hypothetical protein [Hydrogenophaga sp. IBVHS1]|uniref:hypothetical protein n=1 Tax=unclassified Hydrogenophaga TaxID=2610897 RepID=UPI000A2D2685|nr:hypothetical protein [Hydrogenophaga sp. IBVHS1]OSZ76736.1 hypothetical protein CAP37_11325 [Hydrogenophaga sp. IBVHS1]
MKTGKWLVVLLAVGTVVSVCAEMYRVNVRRVDQDLYKTSEGFFIQTKYCYEYTYGDDAVLRYERYSYDNKLIFDSGTTCEVAKVFR